MEYNLRIGWIDHNVFRGGWGYVAPAGLGGYGDHAGLIIKTQRHKESMASHKKIMHEHQLAFKRHGVYSNVTFELLRYAYKMMEMRI